MHEAMQDNLSYPFYLAQAHAMPSPSKHDIEQDLHRTFPNDEEFTEEKLTSLRNILLAYSMRNREVGYCQSMNFLAAFIMMQYGDGEEQAFWLLASLIENILPPRYYTSDMKDILIDILVFFKYAYRVCKGKYFDF